MRDRLLTISLPVAITLAGFLVAYQFVDPAPSNELSIATGQKEGSYFNFGNQYQSFLAQHAVRLNVESTAGSIDNLQRLKSGKVDVAFVQGGIASAAKYPDLTFLGSLYFEPLWVFHSSAVKLSRLSDLRGKRIAIGAKGSGTRAIALQLLADNGIDESSADILPLTGSQAAAALAESNIDALFLVTSAQSPLIEQLLKTHGAELMSFDRAEGYTRKHPFLSAISLPEGAMDMAANIPGKRTWLLAPSATLIARNGLHPALQTLLLQAAAKIHSANGLFEKQGEFPSSKYGDLPISEDAQRFYKSGPPFLQRFLPFWAATLIDRLKVMLLPLIALLLPLFKVMPPIYRWRIRSRIYQHYKDLTAIEEKLSLASSDAEIKSCIEELEQIEHEVRLVHVPLSYSEEAFQLRSHLALVRSKAEKRAVTYSSTT
jgi:TRAP transporter TAXI family solute receptor